MLILIIVILCLFSLYYVFAEYRIYRVISQRNYWHDKYLELAVQYEVTIPPEDLISSVTTP